MSARDAYDVAGKTVFVTGAARGIGAASAERLHSRGANVALVGLEPELLEERAARLGERAIFCEADVTDLSAVERAVEETVSRFGGVDVAIANAGIAFTGSLATEPVEYVERTLAVNLLGVWRTDRAVIGEIQRRKGYLLNIASLSAVAHAPLMGPYTCAKAGVEALTDALRMEAALTGARVGCAYFGFIDTDLVRASFAERSTNDMLADMPAFMSRPAPLEGAIDAIERGVARRAARVWYPRWVGPMIALRGVLQPLSERRLMRDPERLRRAIAEADAEAVGDDPVLGVAARALADHPERSGVREAGSPASR
jgi:NAD(P)-dependent dehydrogenase (short-subunit alcohol dehydrogenase family)